MKVIEKEGLDGFSFRKLAAALGCEAMSIYHHFPSKAHLMDALLDRFLAEAAVPPPGRTWEERVRRLAEGYRQVALRHPAFFPFVAVHRHNTPAAMKWLDEVVGLVGEGGFDPEMTARVFRVIGYYLVGALLDETAGYARGPSAAEPVSDAVAARDYPRIAPINPYFKPDQHKATFELGLEALLAGIRQFGAGRRSG